MTLVWLQSLYIVVTGLPRLPRLPTQPPILRRWDVGQVRILCHLLTCFITNGGAKLVGAISTPGAGGGPRHNNSLTRSCASPSRPTTAFLSELPQQTRRTSSTPHKRRRVFTLPFKKGARSKVDGLLTRHSQYTYQQFSRPSLRDFHTCDVSHNEAHRNVADPRPNCAWTTRPHHS